MEAEAVLVRDGRCVAWLSSELTEEDCTRLGSVRGSSDATYDEDGYLWLPPCQWSEHDPRLTAPPVLKLDHRLMAVKRSNSSVYHYGVMGIFQMRGAYLT